MRKVAKIATVGMALAMASSMVLSTAACRSTEDLIKDGKTINVKVFSAGYGTDYIYALQEKFEEAFADEGYKLNIFTPLAGFSGEKVLQDIASGVGADVYFSTFVREDQLVQEAYANTVADITELVYNQKPINFSGEETGDKTIKQIMEEDTYGYIGYQRADGSYYALPYQQGCRGLAVNLSVLADYELEIPKTSKEFFHCYDVIMEKAAETGVFPITHIASQNNYPCSFTNCWMAQYEGYDWYQKYFTFQNDDGSNMSNEQIKEMYNADGIYHMLNNMYHALDQNCGTYGSQSQGLEKAQAKLFNGSCAFMMNGDWLISETYNNYSDKQRENLAFVNVPVISELGVKVFGEGTSYNKSEEDCEKILRAIIDEVDSNKNLADIKAVVDAKFSTEFALADIERIAEARGFVYTESSEAGVYVNARSEIKDLAALLLRFCASEEAGELLSAKMYSANPFCKTYASHRYEWVNSARAIMSNQYMNGLYPSASGYKAELAKTVDSEFSKIFPYTGTYVNLKIIADKKTMYDAETLVKTGSESLYATAAQSMADKIYNDAVNRLNK